MAEEEQELVGEWEASSDLFLPETISRMSNHFKILVEGIVNNFQEKISKLPLCTWHEEQWLVNELNQNQTPYPKNTTIPQQFEFQVKRSPEKVAVVFNNQSLTYSELNARGDRLAAYLQALGVGPETLVGICVEKSLEMIVGLLGILKAGAAYVPLDASYPQERISFMLSDADIRIVLTQDSLSELLNSELLNNELYLILLETFTEEFESYKTTPEVIPSLTSLTYKSYQELTPDNLAYVMYTSGTTGIPKGVCVTHQNVIRLIRETNYANFDESLVFLQLASISFDASTFEIWGALLNGAKLAIANTQTPSLKDLGESIRHHGITTLWLTSGLFQLVVDEILDDLEPVRQLLAGGDVLSVQHVRKFVSTYPDCQLINGYGPTENTTFTCCYTVQDSKYLNRKSIPIGRPIANSEVYICDREMQLAPIGVPGELYVGGDGLARGYLNRPDLTEEKFVSNVLSGVVGKRLYKTGDLARYLPDGNIEFLGRLDRQVKIRGFRIEPEEIEFALMEYSGVKSAVVIDREDIPGDKRLVAYVVSQEELTGGDLRRFLKSKLPSYAIPSAFVFLKALPLTPNGKIDRSLLPAPEISHKHEGKVVTPPRSSMEKALTTIWTEVLKVEEIGIHDNFFDLGGHSLLSIQLIAHIRTHLSLELPLKCIFENPTIAELAEYIETVDWLNQNNTETLNRSEFEIGKL
jgi:aspartate racemase